MTTVEKFDPTTAVQYWMKQKNRNTHKSDTRKEQEYFKNVFEEADKHRNKEKTRTVSF